VPRQVGVAPAEAEPVPNGTLIVTVVAGRVFGGGSPALHHKAIALARLARTDLVRFVFDVDSEQLLWPEPFPPPDHPETEEAVLATLAGG
jgi:hypothetical protein